jgi:hypothetical protein
MDCIVCGAKDIRPSMGGNNICGACDCGGMLEMGGHKYIRFDFLSNYGYEKKEPIQTCESKCEHKFMLTGRTVPDNNYLLRKVSKCKKCGFEDVIGLKESKKMPSVEEIEKILESFITHILWYHDKEGGRTEDVEIIFKSRFKDLALKLHSLFSKEGK